MQETLMGFTDTRRDELIAAFRAAFEMHHQGGQDWCGDQREYHLPRARTLMLFFMKTYPNFAMDAIVGAKNGYGDLIEDFEDAK